jgi:hypothetical protein
MSLKITRSIEVLKGAGDDKVDAENSFYAMKNVEVAVGYQRSSR